MDGFKFGFMPSFNSDLLEQINFAKANFDFLELTLSYDLKEWTPEYVAIVKKSLGSLPIVGHNHWGIDLTATDGAEKTIEAFEILHALGVRKIVIHPSFPENIDPAEAPSRNLDSLKKIVDFCNKSNIDLLAENGDSATPDIIGKLRYLTEQIPGLNIALDIGHATNNWQEFVEVFGNKIRHLHLHYSDAGDDHLPFPKDYNLSQIIDFLNRRNITATLEVFRKKENGNIQNIEEKEREEILLEQVKMIKGKRVI